MGLQQQLTDDLKEAMRKSDAAARSAIRLVMAAVKNAEIAKGGPLEESDVLGLISKAVKQRQESIEAFKKGDRADLVAQEEAEMAVLARYLPQQMTRQEIVEAARRVIEEVGARAPSDKGKVMPKLMSQLRGRADGRDINQVVTELLSGAQGA